MDSNLRREIILDNYNNPFHKKVNDNYEKVNTNNESCIDNIDIYFKFNDDVLEDVSFFGEACAISTSATSILLRNIIGKTKEEIYNILTNYDNMINEKEYDRELLRDLVVYDEKYLQTNRKNCAQLPSNAVKNMLKKLESM